MQRLFTAEGPWPTPWLEPTLPVIQAIAGRHPERTVFTRFIPPEKPEDMPGMWQRYYRRWPEATRSELKPELLELVPSLARLAPPAVVMDKPVYSPFSGSHLPHHLAERGADALIVTGAETDVCVLATVLGAVDHGFRVVLVTDAVCSSSDAGHHALFELFRTRFTEQVEVTNAETVLSAWQRH
ncbi:MAG: isochorismatase family cysteine hydrolase [Bauldia sp.]